MKKYLLLTIISLALANFSFGQLRVLIPGAQHLSNNGDTIVKYGSITDGDIQQVLYIVNTGHAVNNVYARCDSLSTPNEYHLDHEICWAGFCYDTNTNISPYSENIGSGDTTNSVMLGNDFIGHYFPEGFGGKAYIGYWFYDRNNPTSTDSSAYIVIEYNATPAGVQNIAGSVHMATPYPNPANSLVTINYNFTSGIQSAQLKIFNMLGECVRTLPLSGAQSTVNMNVQGMPSGIYVCELQAQGYSPVYQKMVVSH